VHINDIKLPANVKTAIKDRNFTVVTVAGRTKEEEEIKPVAAAATAEGAAAAGTAAPGAAPGAAAPAAGAKPAAGVAAPAAGAKPAGKDEKKK
jgi:large subunit ribosomal protein L25